MDLFVAKPVGKPALVAAILHAIGGAAETTVGVGDEVHDLACDPVALAALIEDIGRAGGADLVDLFIAETRSRLRRMASPDGNSSWLCHEMHTLKGAAGTVCAPRLAALAAALDARLRIGGSIDAIDLDGLAAAFAAYVAEVRAVIPLEPAVA